MKYLQMVDSTKSKLVDAEKMLIKLTCLLNDQKFKFEICDIKKRVNCIYLHILQEE